MKSASTGTAEDRANRERFGNKTDAPQGGEMMLPQGPRYTSFARLQKAKTLDEVFSAGREAEVRLARRIFPHERKMK